MERFWAHIGWAAGFLLALIVIASLIVQRAMFPTLAYWIVGDLIAGAAMAVPLLLVGMIVALAFLLRGRVIETGQFGNYIQGIRGVKALPPLAVAAPKLTSGSRVTEVEMKAPKLGDLIQQGLLLEQSEDGMKMLMGFRVDESPRYEPWPGVIAITGQQNVGKSVTMTMLVVIALLQGAHIVVCDTHKTKPRSISKKLAALEGVITFANTEDDVLRETQKYSEELHNRKTGSPPYPYILFYDEFNSLVKSQNEELRKSIPVAMEEGGREGHGYEMHVVAAIHDLSNSGIGDANIRGFFNWIYCHRMEAIQSKFIEAFNTRQNRKLIAGLPAGHAVVRDLQNEVEYLIIPEGGSKDVLLARQMIQGVIPERSVRPVNPTFRLLERPDQERSTEDLEPVEPLGQYGTFQEDQYVPERSEGVPGNVPQVELTSEDVLIMANAYAALLQKEEKPSKRKLLLECGWGGSKYNLVQAFCKQRGILQEKVSA